MKYQETNTVELKPSLSQLNEIVETIVGLANSKGGTVIIGVSNAGEVVGVEIGKATLEKLVNTIKQNTEPSLYPKIVVKIVGKKKVIEVSIAESKEKPVLAFGRAFKRVGKSTLKIDKDEQERMVVEKKKVYFDSQICEKAKLSDLEEEKVRQFVGEAKRQRNLALDNSLSLSEMLLRLRLAQEKKITNAAILLFGKDPQKFFLQAATKVIRFKGTVVTGEMLDFKNIEGDILTQLRKAEDFIFEHIPQKAWIEGEKLQRQEKWLYPPEALREALANAFAHRDYQLSSGIQVRIFDDRLEIWNPGSLPRQLTIEQLRGKHESIPRNPLLARAFFWVRYAEEVGTGTNKIMGWCKKWDLPEPRFEVTGTSFIITFKRYAVSEGLFKTLNVRQQQAVRYLEEHQFITNQKYRELNPGITDRTAHRDLRALLAQGILITQGEKKLRKYWLR